MDVRSAAALGDAEELARFRRLVAATIVATFVLILIGGIVRVSDSGLGCGPAGSGTQGWPLCEGGFLPAASGESVIEFSHRIAAGIVGVLVAICAWQAIRRLREHRALVRGSLAAVALVLIQAALGGLTVELGLDEELVAAHLGLAMLLIGLLILLRRGASVATEPIAPRDSRGMRALSVVAATLVLATIVAGGYVAGTEKEGTPSEPAAGQAHVACGEQFPGCNGSFLPFGQSRLVDIQLTHRVLMYLAATAVLGLIALALRRRVPSRPFLLAGALLGAQILLGAMNVWLGKHAGLIIAHLALGTLLWSSIVYAAASLLAVPEPAPQRLRRAAAAGAAA